jgi:YbbR domain-containing protein
MRDLKELLIHNWFIKLFSLILAALLWVVVSSETSSEIAVEAPLEYRNIPPDLEVATQTTTMAQVRLRGATNRIQGVSAQDITMTVDLGATKPGESVFPLNAQNVSAPFGVEVVQVSPSRVRIKLERTVSRQLPVRAVIEGKAAPGFEVFEIRVTPGEVEVQGPESAIEGIESIPTVPVRVEGEQSSVREFVDLDPGESVRPMNSSPVEVQVDIRRKP